MLENTGQKISLQVYTWRATPAEAWPTTPRISWPDYLSLWATELASDTSPAAQFLVDHLRDLEHQARLYGITSPEAHTELIRGQDELTFEDLDASCDCNENPGDWGGHDDNAFADEGHDDHLFN
jgi:hypothetical protein